MIVAVNAPRVAELHERIAVPEPVRLVGEIGVQVSPDCAVAARPTTPLNPFRPASVIVDVAGVVAGTEAGEVAEMLKS